MADASIPPLGPGLASLFEAERARTAVPAPGARDAAFARVTAKLGAPGAGAGAGARKVVAASLTGKGLVALAFVVGAAAGSAVTAGVIHRSPDPRTPPAVVAAVNPPPSASPAGVVPQAAEVSEVSAPRPGAARTLAEERRILDRAQLALTRGDPSAAIAAGEEHGARFPAGQLEDEREALLVQALALAHRDDEARARAGAFLARHPNSVLRRVVERAVDPKKL